MSVVAIPQLACVAPISGFPASSWLRIGDVGVALHGPDASSICLHSEVESFRSHPIEADLDVEVLAEDTLIARSGVPDFDSGAVWRMFREEAGFVFDFTTPVLGAHPYKRMHVDRNFRKAKIALNRSLLSGYAEAYPLEYPTDELLITSFLAAGGGVEVHGCGLIDEYGQGHLFLGHSGAGKSTTTLLWNRAGKPVILSDDRIILRMKEDGLWMYGTPWHGEAAFACNARAKLNRILILQHGAHNNFKLLPTGLAAGELFARSFPPFHDPIRLANTVDFLARVAERLPCYQFSFTPDASAVRAVIAFHG